MLERLRLLAWKELVEVYRDRRTLAFMVVSAMLLPALGLLVTGLQAQQEALVAIVDCDETPFSRSLVDRLLEAYSETPGYKTVVAEGCAEPPPGTVFTIVLPRGLGENATSIDRLVVVEYRRLAGSVAAERAKAVADTVLARVSHELARERVERLAERAGVEVGDPDTVLYPIRTLTEIVTATGAQAPPGLEQRAAIARFLAFAVFFVLNPAAIAVADAFIGERERGTAEMLASSPLRPWELVAGKMAGGTLLAVMAAAIDAAGVLAYLLVAGARLQGLGPDLALVHAAQTLLAVVVTAALAAPIAIHAPTPRSATLGSLLVTGMATAVFFASFFVDLDKLPPAIQAALYVIPYTHTAIAIQAYATGAPGKTLAHTLAQILVAAALLALAAKTYNPERYIRQT